MIETHSAKMPDDDAQNKVKFLWEKHTLIQ